MAKTRKEWLEAKLHMPHALRDFHAQKDIFKAVQHWVGKAQAEKPGDHMVRDLPNWIVAHIYVIDFFLWFMAVHGYTLQRAEKRSGFEFEDLSATLETMREHEAAALRAMMDKVAEEEKQG
jgi:hypothetical protein